MKSTFKLPVSPSFLLVVIVPIIAAALYYAFFASKQYVVETKYIIQGHQQQQSDMFGALAGLAGGAASPSAKDSYIAREYIWSAELLKKLDKDINVRAHYADPEYDRWARLSADAPFSDYLDYWYDTIDIRYDATSGITTLGVTAFTADYALLIAQRLLSGAEEHVNKLSDRSRNDSLNFAKAELKNAEDKLIQARAKITRFRNVQKEIDPEKTTSARLQILTELEGKLSDAQGELSNLISFMKSDSFQVRTLKNKVSTIKRQIRNEKKRWGDTDSSKNTLTTQIAEYEKILAQKMVAERLYESSLGSLEAARLSAIQQQQYLEVITAPYKPSEAEKPYVMSKMITVILGSFLLWAIGTLLVSAVRDHS